MENSSQKIVVATYKQIEEAKALLKSQGYYVDNLWSVADVKGKFNCTDEEAQYCLDKSLNNEATMEQIWLSIDIFGEMENLTRVFNYGCGSIVSVGDSVDVNEPITKEAYTNGFTGNVIKITNDGIVVEDLDGNCFTVDVDEMHKSE